MKLIERFSAGLTALDLSLENLSLFMTFLEILEKWNRTFNLTAIRDQEDIITRHFLDSLAISPWVLGPRLLDIGTGAGFPGLPLAIAHPFLQVTLLDSNGKKIRFLQEVKRQLSLQNVEIQETRVENWHPIERFNTIVSRAFSELSQMINWSSHLLTDEGRWLAMKGKLPEAELLSISNPYTTHQYMVPGLQSERCLVWIKPLSSRK